MPTLILRFTGQGYHATPWGHHVNEGLVEWPPSPWRLLRALLAVGYAKLHWSSDGPPPAGRSLFAKLASGLPTYRLPAASGTHSRHFMPLATFDEKRREKTTMVFDTWARVRGRCLAVRWNEIALSSEEEKLLDQLARALGYLGRAESWVECEMAHDSEPLPPGSDAFPCSDREPHRPGWEQVAMLAAVPEREYASWREGEIATTFARAPIGSRKEGSKASQVSLDAIQTAYPRDLVACLQADTGWLRARGWSQPPGSRRVLYWRRSDSLETAPPRSQVSAPRGQEVEAVLLAIATATGSRNALPSNTRVLPQAELLHRALNAHASRIAGHSPVLSGRDVHRQPLRDRHRHAHLLHLDLDDDGRLDHVLLWAPMGFDAVAQGAIRAVRRTFTKGGTAPLRLAVAATGSLADLGRLPEPFGRKLRALFGEFSGRATMWRSLTPFVPPRHLKKRGRDTLEGQVEAELESRGMMTAVAVAVLDPHEDIVALRGRHFVRHRSKGPRPPLDCGFMLELQFREPVDGPLVLGYGSHFGLGLFESERREGS